MPTLKWLWAAILSALLAGNANAILVSDVDPSDANRITRQETLVGIPELPPAYRVAEDYNEGYLIPYASHDGYGIVNRQGGFFDEIVDLQNATGWWTFDFRVTNTSPYVWSDYHFEFWTPNFGARLTNFPLGVSPTLIPEGPYSNAIFTNSAFDGSILSFWSPRSQSPGQANDFLLTMNLDQVRANYGTAFGIRQVATTPEPGTLALLALALGGLAFMRRHRSMIAKDR